jgi:hypothetical protein
MDAAGTKRAYTRPVDPPYRERLMRSLAISGTFWPEVPNVNLSDPYENSGVGTGATQSQAERLPQGLARGFDGRKSRLRSILTLFFGKHPA